MDLDQLALALIGGPIYLIFFPWWLRIGVLFGLVIYWVVFREVVPKTKVSSVRHTGGILKSVDSADIVTHLWGLATIPEIFERATAIYAESPLLGTRTQIKIQKEQKNVEVKGKTETKTMEIYWMSDYKFLTYREVGKLVAQIGAGLRELGVKREDKVCLFANTRAEWQMSFQACLANTFPIVTVYSTLGTDALVFGFNQTEVEHIITEITLLPTLLKTLGKVKPFQTVVYFQDGDGKVDSALEAEFKGKGVKLLSFAELLNVGKAGGPVPEEFRPQAEDLAVIMYTSGSTGEPKGVEVTHANVTATVAGLVTFVDRLTPTISKGDTFLAFLPLAHIFEMAAETCLIARGATIGYATVRTLTDDTARNAEGKPMGDISALRPTMIAAVPAILDRFRDKILSGTKKSPVTAYMFKLAYYLKLRNYVEGRDSPFWDKLVFNKIKAKFGGRIKYIVSGGAPLSVETQKLIDLCLAPVIQGYGLTETCSSASLRHPQDRTFGHVGGPLANCELKLIDVPEMNYRVSDTPSRGEVLIRGGPVTRGYYKNQKETDEVYKDDDSGRWFHTGDIASVLEHGAIEIIDRRKDLVKMVQGEYVALGKLESIYRNCPYVEQICVYGNPHKDAPVAVIVPNEHELEKLAKSKGVSVDLATMCSNSQLVDEIKRSLDDEAKKARLARFEMLKAVLVVPDSWTPGNGLLTEAMKLKRKPVTDKYKEKLEELYK